MKNIRIISMVALVMLAALLLTGCDDHTAALPTADPAATSDPAVQATGEPSDSPNDTESPVIGGLPVPFTDYEVLLTLPLRFIDSNQDLYLYDPFLGEDGCDSDLLVPKPEYDDACIVAARGSMWQPSLEHGVSIEKLTNASFMIQCGPYGESGAYVFNGRLFRIYVFEDGEHINTIEIEPWDYYGDQSCAYINGLWYICGMDYGFHRVDVYDNYSNLVRTFYDWPQTYLTDNSSKPQSFIGTEVQPDGTELVIMSSDDYINDVYKYNYYDLSNGSFELVYSRDANDFDELKEQYGCSELSATQFSDGSSVGVFYSACEMVSADGKIVTFPYAYIRAFDADMNPIGGFDSFDYLNLRFVPDCLYAYVTACSTEQVYALLYYEDYVQMVRIPLDSDFEPYCLEQGATLPYTHQQLWAMGLDENLWELPSGPKRSHG